jgi:hypothetical protein
MKKRKEKKWIWIWDLGSFNPHFFLPLYCLSFGLRLLITSLCVAIVLSVLRFTASDYLPLFCHCIVCPSVFGFWLPPFVLPLYCLSFDLRLLITSLCFVIVLSVLRFTASDYPPLFCHCIVCPSVYGFWLPPFVLSLYCLSFDLRLLITSLWKDIIPFAYK